MTRFTLQARGALLCLIVVQALFWNRQFLHAWPLPVMLKMNDVGFILVGYRSTPRLFPDSLRWWHGSWIHQDVSAFRPISSYLYWIDCWIGLRWGFVWTAWLGFLLLAAVCLLSTALAWRLTRSPFCAFFAAALAPMARVFNAGQPTDWLAWFPVQHDLLMVVLLLGALLRFDTWFLGGGRKALASCWAFFLLGCFAKEYVYVFPLFAAAAVLFRHAAEQRPRRQGLAQAGAMLLAVLAFRAYRSTFLVHPRDPVWGPTQLFHSPLLYVYFTSGRYLLTGQGWVVGLAALLLLLSRGFLRYRRGTFRQSVWGRRLGRPAVWLPGLLAVLGLYLACATGSALGAVWFFVDGEVGATNTQALVIITFEIYATWLLWKYRKQEQTALAWFFLLLSYVPVLSFVGWHYCLPGWFFRAPYTALIAKLIWLEMGRPNLPALTSSGSRNA